jgi:hypothetical protein
MNAVIRNESNNLAALVLSAYTEALGGFYAGTLSPKNSGYNYNGFIYTFFPPEYTEVDSKMAKDHKYQGLYKSVRCSVVHEYLIRDRFMSIMDYGDNENCGIRYDPNGKPPIKFYVKQYLSDFRRAFNYYLELIESDNYLLLRFIRALRSIDSKPPITYRYI